MARSGWRTVGVVSLLSLLVCGLAAGQEEPEEPEPIEPVSNMSVDEPANVLNSRADEHDLASPAAIDAISDIPTESSPTDESSEVEVDEPAVAPAYEAFDDEFDDMHNEQSGNDLEPPEETVSSSDDPDEQPDEGRKRRKRRGRRRRGRGDGRRALAGDCRSKRVPSRIPAWQS